MNYVNIDTKNKTKIVATKQIVENLRTNEAIRNYIISSVSEIFKDKEILKKQKVVAIKNLVKDLKVAINNDTFKYSLNLVIRNLNEYHNLQKSETKDENGKVKNFIPTQEAQAIIQALVLLAYSNSLAKICKNLYKDKKGV
ncbi:hypothetical protein N5T66_04890 [Aliarcobacter cryaerophilus]|jgi:hypothetical protein|uniref:hypothetical protein n=1 Tax=Aliarcobacter cryaerophilus TaxID=28198 RepID=UPI0021B1C410|nr:hypothetical protein [Aliarcobacter cryaerophilus]MCT7432609.1 hypothetical protein [Aliarcobacter cryaerophilus]